AATASIQTPMGEVKGRADLYSPILDRLADGPIRLSQLVAHMAGPDKTAAAVIQAVGLLIHSRQVKMVRPDTEADWGPARRVNLARARGIGGGKSGCVAAAPWGRSEVRAERGEF